MRAWMLAAMLATGSVAMVAAPQGTAQTADSDDADEEMTAISALVSQGFSLQSGGDYDKSREAFLAARARAKDGGARHAADTSRAPVFLEQQGIAAYYAAEADDPDWSDRAARDAETEWLIEAATLLAPAVAADPKHGPHYEFRLAGERLFARGVRYDDRRLTDWSALRIAGNRARVAAFPDDATEKNFLAGALYDHGWLTGDAAATAEAERIIAAMDAEDVTFEIDDKRAAVAVGKQPYEKPGDEDW